MNKKQICWSYPLFFSESSTETYKKILDWRKTLNIRPEANISKEAEDILRKLINDRETRLGINGADEIIYHPFFKGTDWNHIKESLVPPFIPKLKNSYDTKYFDEFEEDEPFYPINNDNSKGKKYQKKICVLQILHIIEKMIIIIEIVWLQLQKFSILYKKILKK